MSRAAMTNTVAFLLTMTFSVLAGCSTGHPQPEPAATPAKGDQIVKDESFIGVRVLKTDGSGKVDWLAQMPKGCTTCRLHNNEYTSGQNPKEFYFHFLAPTSLKPVAGVHVKVDPAKVRGVLVGHSRVAFHKTSDGITFDAPQNGPKVSELSGYHSLPADGAGDVTDQYTYLDTPGVETRVEHANEQRKNGLYSTGPWPAIERQAALNLEFAAREAIVSLGIDRQVRERGLGTILLMGFDTNYPTLGLEGAHVDYPPHWHMHFSWAQDPIIREVGHFNIGLDGLLTENIVSYEQTQKGMRFGRGDRYATRTPDGETLFTQSITKEGFFEIGSSGGSCRLTPVSGGFQSGIEITCDNGSPRQLIHVEDDIQAGHLRVFRDDKVVEEHLYDPDNGVLKRSVLVYADRNR